MERITVPIIQNNKEKEIIEIVYNVNDFPYNKCLKDISIIQHKTKGRYYNVSSAFDIETTTLEKYREDGERYGQGFMYQWQYCINKYVCFGRTWEEFLYFIEQLQINTEIGNKSVPVKLCTYVHNLAYEFQFIKDFFKWKSVFSKDAHKVMKAETENGIEFRCSYFLSNMTLAKFCENSALAIHYKLTDTYDYKKVRTPRTELTPIEKAYCFNDVYGLCECIDTMLLEDTLLSIPITNTGYVRRDFRRAMKSNVHNDFKFRETALTSEQYTMLRKMFRGGNTHANRLYATTILYDVYSVDLQSSYPSVLMLDYFPVTKFIPVTLDTKEKINKYTSKYCVIMEIDFYNIRQKENDYIPYIDVAHCNKHKSIINDNGRVKSAEYIGEFYCNEIDLNIITSHYDIERLEVKRAFISNRGKMPKEFRERLMYWYGEKTRLKDTGHEYEYAKSKNRVNSAFGMLVQSIIENEVIFEQFATDEDGNIKEWANQSIPLEDAIQKYYSSKNSFLSYQWGVYVTSHARRRLQQGIDLCGVDDVYQDTDSVKFLGEFHVKQFEELNKEIIKQCEKEHAYVDDRGKRWYLGIWDYEGKSDRFRTFGAKKYATEKGGKFTITVAGMNKKKGSQVIGNMENFELGKTYDNVGRTISWYNDEPKHEITVNGDTFTTASNIGILDTTYTLGITSQYFEVMKDANPYILFDYPLGENTQGIKRSKKG